jgi:hypothetical protein
VSHVWVSTMNGPEFLDAFRASNCLWTAPPSPHSTIDQRISQSFLSCPGPSRTDPNRLLTWQCECLSVASSPRPETHSPRFICIWFLFRIRNGSSAIHPGKVRPPVSQREAAFGSVLSTNDQRSSRSRVDDPQGVLTSVGEEPTCLQLVSGLKVVILEAIAVVFLPRFCS